jgi:hypothetical protein
MISGPVVSAKVKSWKDESNGQEGYYDVAQAGNGQVTTRTR